jgi:hypothetical protein
LTGSKEKQRSSAGSQVYGPPKQLPIESGLNLELNIITEIFGVGCHDWAGLSNVRQQRKKSGSGVRKLPNNVSDNILEDWGLTVEEFTQLVHENPSLRGVLIGYMAELKLNQMWLSSSEISESSKPDDHDRKKKGDRTITYRGHRFVIESKSLQTAMVKKIGDTYYGKSQCDASDCRDVVLPNGHTVKTTLLLTGEFDILAVNIFAFEQKWAFVFAKNKDLPRSTFRNYPPEDREYLIASLIPVTWPVSEPFRTEPFSLMDEIIGERQLAPGAEPEIAIVEGEQEVKVFDTEHPRRDT